MSILVSSKINTWLDLFFYLFNFVFGTFLTLLILFVKKRKSLECANRERKLRMLFDYNKQAFIKIY